MRTYYLSVTLSLADGVTPTDEDGSMVLATAHTGFADSLPASLPTRATAAADPGVAARMSSLTDGLGSLVADLDPELLLGSDAASLYAAFCRLERLIVAGKTLLAPRIAASGHWEAEGHRSPATLLAELEGGSPGQAKRTLLTGQLLTQLPSTEEALRQGTLSGAKVAEIAGAAATDPDAEGMLLAGSDADPLHVVKERCQRVRATSTRRDPLAAERRIHAGRFFRSWTDPEGAFCYQGRDTAERGARLQAALTPVANRLRDDRRAAARDAAARLPKGATGPSPEPEAALRADALFLLLTGRRPRRSTPPSAGDSSGRPVPSGPSVSTATDLPSGSPPADSGDDLGGPDDLITSAPPATVMVRVDLEALRRRHAESGELCELDGQGPVPVPVVASLIDDAFVSLVFTESGDIRSVSHLGRTINSHLRTALAFRDRCCVVPGCRVAYGLEIDHVVPMESGGPTELDNLALLCRHHHRMKTYDGWDLARSGPTDEEPVWTFTPMPPFGQEPELGLDRPGSRSGIGDGAGGGDRPEQVPRT